MLTFGSLFAGIGGFDLGFERAGLRCKWQVEINEFCRRVLEKHWPNVTRWDDITTFPPAGDWSVDIVCGGFPCQPFSSASRGRKRGTEDDRYLWPEMLRVVQVVKPTWVVAENVTHLDGMGLEQVVSDLEASGYEVAPPLEIPACAVGHDHRRARIWILGYSNRIGKSGLPINAEMAGLSWSDREPRGVGAKDGISSRMDRLAAIGNAVCPGIVERIGRYIADASAA